MRFHSSHFLSYQPSLDNHTIIVADGSHTPIAGYDDIQLSPPLFLKMHSMFLTFPLILFPITNLPRIYLNCVVTFHAHCIFQDLAKGKTIGVTQE